MTTDNRTKLDSVTLKVLWDRLVSIVNEATVAQYRTAFSAVVQEALDFACSIMDKNGTTLANSEGGLPSFIATQAFTLQALLQRFPLSEIQPGDVFITNDPWIGTGQAMDLTLLKPIFKHHFLVAFAGSVAHAPDLGGAQRWNLSLDVFDEAILLPLMKLYERGVPNATLLSLLRANSRMPDKTIGDLESQLAALQRTEIRLLEVMDEYGLDDLDELVAAIYERSEGAMREAIEKIPDGEFRGELWSDGFPDPVMKGQQTQEPILLRATVTVKGSNMTVDYTGSSPQRPGSFNSVWTFTSAYALYGLRMMLVPYLANNGAFYRPIKIICPEGTVVNARYPSACLSRHLIGHLSVDVIYTALAPVLPDQVLGQSGSAPSWDLLLMGEDKRGRSFHTLTIVNGGSGAAPQQDGYIVAFPANLRNTPVEIMESVMPLVCEGKEVIVDSAGMGRQRGGFGQRMIFRALAPLGYSLINARIAHAAQGLLGGTAGRAGHAEASGLELPSGSDGTLQVGERLVLETPGGGGLGPVAERDPQLIEADLREGLISHDPRGAANGHTPM
ncbi:MAG TPA: hydantoinase B/oxoprolinase family protein [Anaerolineae bacterium]|nr:hydantoinase B/oxoprolinase family protein [Anaerolineae bacterium]